MKQQKARWGYIFVELVLVFIIITLGIKIRELIENKILGVHVSVLKKEDIISDNSYLKYFYEPKPNSAEIYSPSWLGYSIKNNINSDSLNSSKNYSVDKLANTYRIITLGDSFTFGLNVNTDENYSSQLEEMLNSKLKCKNITQFEVINLGVSGYDIEYAVERFEKRGMKYNPDLVIWLLNYWNFVKINEYYLPLKESLIGAGIPEFKKHDNGVIEYYAADKAEKLVEQQLTPEEKINYQQKAILRLGKSYNGKIWITSFSSFPAIYKPQILELINSNSHSFKFYNNITDTAQNNKYRLPDWHPNVLGHKIIAEDIFKLLHNELKNCELLN